MAETDQQGHEVFNFVQVSSDFGTNMTSVGFQVIIYITMFLDVTPCSDECPQMAAVLLAITLCHISED